MIAIDYDLCIESHCHRRESKEKLLIISDTYTNYSICSLCTVANTSMIQLDPSGRLRAELYIQRNSISVGRSRVNKAMPALTVRLGILKRLAIL